MQTVPQTLLIAAVLLHQVGGCCLHHAHAAAERVAAAVEHAGACCDHDHDAPQPSSHPAGECDGGACSFNRCTNYLDVDSLFDFWLACPVSASPPADAVGPPPALDVATSNIGSRPAQPLYLLHQILLI